MVPSIRRASDAAVDCGIVRAGCVPFENDDALDITPDIAGSTQGDGGAGGEYDRGHAYHRAAPRRRPVLDHSSCENEAAKEARRESRHLTRNANAVVREVVQDERRRRRHVIVDNDHTK